MVPFHPSALATSLMVWGLVTHLVIDWLLQNDWMARNKSNLRHPAAWVHSGLHTLGLLLFFPVPAAILIGVLHLLIDTRVPLVFWRRVYRQTTTGDIALHVALWGDQVAHVLVIALVALVIGR